MYIGLIVRYPLVLSYLKKLEFFRKILKSGIRFYEDPSSGGRVVPRVRVDGQT